MNSRTFGMPQGAWRNGDQLIASNRAILLPVCVKCGRPADGDRLKKSFSWHPRWVFVFVLIALLIYIIVALIMRKTISLDLPLCAAHRARYRTLRITAAVLILGSIGEIIAGLAALPDSYTGLVVGVSLLALLAVRGAQRNPHRRLLRLLQQSLRSSSEPAAATPPGMMLPL